MPRLVVVLPLVPLALGDGWALNDWPLHVTIVPTFETESTAADVGAALMPLLAGRARFTVLAGFDEGFGRAADIPVTIIEPSSELVELHASLVSAVKSGGGVFDDPDFVEDGYRAHVTKTRHAAVLPGDSLELAQIAIVDMAPQGDARLRHVVWCQSLGLE
jgi:2'-5' RNA ligase